MSRKANEAKLRKWPKPSLQVRCWLKFVLSSQKKKLFSILHLQDVMHCYKLLLYAISRKTNELNLRKWQKTYFWDWFWNLRPKFGPQTFFCGWCLYKMLEVVISYRCMHFHRKLWIKLEKMAKNLILGSILVQIQAINICLKKSGSVSH